MKKKILNAVELLFLFATFVVLNMKTIEVVSSAVPTEATQFVSTISLWKNYLLSYPIYFFYVVIAVMCVVSIITKSEYREGRIHSILPIIWFVLVTIRLIVTQGETRTWIIVSSERFPQEVFMFFAVGVVVLGFVKRASFIVGKSKVQNKSNAEELAKYKELLDAGVLTQEEFNKKKKELLRG